MDTPGTAIENLNPIRSRNFEKVNNSVLYVLFMQCTQSLICAFMCSTKWSAYSDIHRRLLPNKHGKRIKVVFCLLIMTLTTPSMINSEENALGIMK